MPANKLKANLGECFGLEDRVVLSSVPLAALTAVSNPLQAINSEIIGYDVTTTGPLSFNLNTGNVWAQFKLPAGISFDTAAIRTLLSGSFAMPNIDIVQAATAFANIKTQIVSNYDQVEARLIQQHGGGNVYFSTQRFTNWASPENLANTITSGVLTSGANTAQIVQQAKEVILGELSNIYTWVQNRAPDVAEQVLASAFQSMITGQPVESPYLSFQFENVTQRYTLGVGPVARSFNTVQEGFSIV